MQTRGSSRDVRGGVYLAQPNVNNEEIQVTTKLRCYPAYKVIKKDKTTGISISICEIVARSAGLPAEIFLAIIVVCTVAGLYIA